MGEMFGKLFGWLDKPWKAVVFLVTLPLLLIAYLAYMEMELIDQYLRGRFIEREPVLNLDIAEEQLGELLEIGDLAVLFDVVIEEN